MKAIYPIRKRDRTIYRSTKLIDLTGMKFGRLTVLKRSSRQGRVIWWECVCECGVWKEVRGFNLRNGSTKSCGCLNWDIIHGIEHGMTGTPEYICWSGIKRRCYNPKDTHWKTYGGRGISVCERWVNSFENFYADMGPRPDGYTIERVDVNGNYEPSNCKWIPARDQHCNKTNTRRITAFGREQIFADWARELKITPAHLHYHLKRKTLEEIINERSNPVTKTCEFCGEAFSTIKKEQRFCNDSCGSKAHDKRKSEKKREDDAMMFLVSKEEGKEKRYARLKKRSGNEFKWIESRMWASKFSKEDAEKIARQMGDGAITESRGVFIREKEYANMPLEKNGNGKLVARWRCGIKVQLDLFEMLTA